MKTKFKRLRYILAKTYLKAVATSVHFDQATPQGRSWLCTVRQYVIENNKKKIQKKMLLFGYDLTDPQAEMFLQV